MFSIVSLLGELIEVKADSHGGTDTGTNMWLEVDGVVLDHSHR